MNINSVNLNLLLVFEALLEEKNVSRAAAHIGLSQPAVSNALTRLREPFGDRVVSLIEEYAPGFTSLIEHRQVLSPLDLERRFGITGGNIFHGEMSLDQMFVMRPVAGWARYRTPVEGLFLCGSGAHPGGGVMGAPGFNCAREMLR